MSAAHNLGGYSLPAKLLYMASTSWGYEDVNAIRALLREAAAALEATAAATTAPQPSSPTPSPRVAPDTETPT